MKIVNAPRVVIGACGSGNGKTILTCGLLKALQSRNLQIASFKCGPDYIDPMFHSRVLGTKSRNLDSFFTDDERTKYLFGKTAEGMDISVIEGVMGYYDGLGGVSTKASTYDIARITESPVILILNAKGMSVSILAVIKGFMEYKRDSKIVGVILNHISPSFYETIKIQIEQQFSIKVYGYIPFLNNLKIESRHLGLIAPEEVSGFEDQIQMLAEVLEKTLDIDGILSTARETPQLEYQEPQIPCLEKKVRLGVARDDAFSFNYEDNLELLEQMGAELCYFSPLKDTKLPEGIQGLWLGGGYPERYAKELSANISMRNSVKQEIAQGMPCMAECGGFLYLHKELEGREKQSYPMVGVLNAYAYKTEKLQRFGYIELEAQKESILGAAGVKFPAHEFHYWESDRAGDDFKATKPMKSRSYRCMHATSNLLAGFPHIYLYANIEGAFQFIKKASLYFSSF